MRVIRVDLRETATFWAAVRDEWQRAFQSSPRLTLHAEIDGKPLHEWLFPLSENAPYRQGEQAIDEARALIRRAIVDTRSTHANPP